MTSYKELIAQRDALEKQIAESRQTELAGAVGQVKLLIDEFGLTQEDVFPSKTDGVKARKTSGKVAAKYRNPETGATWTGRGKAPSWIAGKDRAEFTI